MLFEVVGADDREDFTYALKTKIDELVSNKHQILDIKYSIGINDSEMTHSALILYEETR